MKLSSFLSVIVSISILMTSCTTPQAQISPNNNPSQLNSSAKETTSKPIDATKPVPEDEFTINIVFPESDTEEFKVMAVSADTLVITLEDSSGNVFTEAVQRKNGVQKIAFNGLSKGKANLSAIVIKSDGTKVKAKEGLVDIGTSKSIFNINYSKQELSITPENISFDTGLVKAGASFKETEFLDSTEIDESNLHGSATHQCLNIKPSLPVIFNGVGIDNQTIRLIKIRSVFTVYISKIESSLGEPLNGCSIEQTKDEQGWKMEFNGSSSKDTNKGAIIYNESRGSIFYVHSSIYAKYIELGGTLSLG